MISKLARLLISTWLLGMGMAASANTIAINILTATGAPQSGGYTTFYGPCYCDEPAFFSPVLLLQPGTYDFGEIREYWVLSGPTPDAGPQQENDWLLFTPVETTGNYPTDFSTLPNFGTPISAICEQTDDACNAHYAGAWVDIPLLYDVPAGQNAIQIALIEPNDYTPPVPEPFMFEMSALALALFAALARRRAPH